MFFREPKAKSFYRVLGPKFHAWASQLIKNLAYTSCASSMCLTHALIMFIGEARNYDLFLHCHKNQYVTLKIGNHEEFQEKLALPYYLTSLP